MPADMLADLAPAFTIGPPMCSEVDATTATLRVPKRRRFYRHVRLSEPPE
jgi:hypothetical protein